MVFMALTTAMVLCDRSQDSLLSVCRVNVSSTAEFKGGGRSRILRRSKPPRCGEASRKPCALSWDRTQIKSALAYGFGNIVNSLGACASGVAMSVVARKLEIFRAINVAGLSVLRDSLQVPALLELSAGGSKSSGS